MERFKGTKGNWKMKHSQSKYAYNIIGSNLGGRYKIARCPYFQDARLSEEFNNKEIDEANANAKLISAAPDLLDVCLKMQHEFKNKLGMKSPFGLDEAIIKALGLEVNNG